MNVYVVSYGIYQYFTIAKDEASAVKKICKKNNLEHLPFTATKIDLEGYSLVKVVSKAVNKSDVQIANNPDESTDTNKAANEASSLENTEQE